MLRARPVHFLWQLEAEVTLVRPQLHKGGRQASFPLVIIGLSLGTNLLPTNAGAALEQWREVRK